MIDVVAVQVLRCVENLAVHCYCSAVVFASCVISVPGLRSVPLVAGQFFIIVGVDNSELTLRQRYLFAAPFVHVRISSSEFGRCVMRFGFAENCGLKCLIFMLTCFKVVNAGLLKPPIIAIKTANR